MGSIHLAQAIGQLLILGFSGKRLRDNAPLQQAIAEQTLGGVILFDYDCRRQQFDKNIESPTQVAQLCQDLQDAAKAAALQHRNHLYPLLISTDHEGGHVTRLKHNKGFGNTYEPAAISQRSPAAQTHYFDDMAATLQQAGINFNCAPCVDLNLNPHNPIIGGKGRSLGATAAAVIPVAERWIQSQTRRGIVSCLKHFPGHGSSHTDSHKGFVDITDAWQPQELEPYKALLSDAASLTVMVGHLIQRGLDPKALPASLSFEIITTLLRQQLGFQGIVLSDDLQMAALTDHYDLASICIRAIQAGNDLLLFGNQLGDTHVTPDDIIPIIQNAMDSGAIDGRQIEASLQRLQRLRQFLKTPANEAPTHAP